ncbi:hypothetical protein HUW51_20265 [Adhaeribacter swui]|uniref:Sulfotransferase family protein n=1 Tax=Adhaeribacter swui TaxID=2086471 RepID=A0A7G7GCQ6_9BACT|nr:hypothetical protein [Adhaeribacter swui]QNF34940.1 hypothetical protein HUW51_20265 [Adhaeribacter swui]
MVIHLISGPRNVSTALMYSFAQRPDTQVMDEPFYAVYLKITGLRHPGREQVLQSLSQDPNQVFNLINKQELSAGNVFVKNMGHHLQGFDYQKITNYQNVFLIREPGQMLYSYAKVREKPTLNDIGLKHQAELFSWLQSQGQQPLVLDGNELRQNPRKILAALCARLHLPFTESMLHWEPGPRAEDGCWAPYWYANVHQSTGFLPPDTTENQLPRDLEEIKQASLPYYQFLKKHAISA